MTALNLRPGHLTLANLRAAYQAPVRLTLDAGAFAAIDASVACVESIIAEGRTAYGINTGFGLLASTRIASHDLEKLQRSLVLSHAAGIGEPLDDAMVRLIMLLKINSLARGFRHSPQGDRGAGRVGQCRGLSTYPAQGLGRCIRRSGAAGAHVAGAAR